MVPPFLCWVALMDKLGAPPGFHGHTGRCFRSKCRSRNSKTFIKIALSLSFSRPMGIRCLEYFKPYTIAMKHTQAFPSVNCTSNPVAVKKVRVNVTGQLWFLPYIVRKAWGKCSTFLLDLGLGDILLSSFFFLGALPTAV